MSTPKSLLVIGGGVGGYTAAIRGARKGMAVTLVESGELGGTCLNVGCIPTKSLLHQAHRFREIGHLSGVEIDPKVVRLNWGAITRAKDDAVSHLVKGVQSLVRLNRIKRVQGTAEFTGSRGVRVRESGAELSGDRIVIATGSRPVLPPIPGIDLPGVVTSDGALSLSILPPRVLIIGGGVIGVEFAQIFSDFGARVTIVEQLAGILQDEEPEVVQVLHRSLSAAGVDFHFGSRVTRIEREGPVLKARLEGPNATAIEAECVLVAVGRAPCVEGLGLEGAGIQVAGGAVVTDAMCRTSQPHIYAVGDVRGGPLLAHKAGIEAEIAVAHMLGRGRPIDSVAIPRAVYTWPEIACVGITEAEARERYGEVKIGRCPFSANGKARTMGETAGLVKVIADAASEQIVGIAMAGPDVTNLLGEATLAVQMELTLAALAETVHAHPTLAEALMEAAHDAIDGGAIHLPPRSAAAPKVRLESATS